MTEPKIDVGYWIDGKDLAQQLLAAEARGYARAIEILRDAPRYERWWTKVSETNPDHGYWQKGRRELADYLEVIAASEEGNPSA